MTTAIGPTKTKLGNLLYLTDFSPISDAAIKYLKAIAEEFDSFVLVAHVVEAPEYRFVPPEGWAVVEQASEEAAKRQLRSVEERLVGVPHQSILRYGEVWKAAADLIKAHNIDLVVVGSHGRTGLRRFLMGSAAEQIFRHANCPVLTVGPGAAKDGTRDLKFERIVLATDFGEASLAAVPMALSLAQDYQARLMLLHVVKQPLDAAESFEQRKSEAERKLRGMAAEESGPGRKVDTAVRLGDPHEEILRFAREKKADLIVLGLRRTDEHLGMATHVSRATAHAVVCTAPCPVLAIRR